MTLVPEAVVIGALAKPSNPNAEHQLRDLRTAARALGRELVAFGVDNERERDQRGTKVSLMRFPCGVEF